MNRIIYNGEKNLARILARIWLGSVSFIYKSRRSLTLTTFTIYKQKQFYVIEPVGKKERCHCRHLLKQTGTNITSIANFTPK